MKISANNNSFKILILLTITKTAILFELKQTEDYTQ